MKLKARFSFIALFFTVSIFTTFASKNQDRSIVVIEAESTKSDLGLWRLVTEKDSNYVRNASGKKHLEFMGGTINGGKPTSPLDYNFTVPANGTYRLMIVCRKRLEGQPGDKCNDGWVKLEGNFTSGNDIPAEDLKKDEKFFGGAANAWGWADLLDWKGHIKRPALYNLKAGEKYKLTLSGRSIRWNVDRIVFFDTLKHKINDVKNIVLPIDPQAALHKWNLSIPGFVAGYFDQGNKAFAINTISQPADKWAAARQVFEGKKAIYTIKFTSLLETDGECSYKVLVNGVEILSFKNPRIHGTDTKEYAPHSVSVDNVSLKNGDIIEVQYLSHSNGLVPENNAFGYARARWRDLEIKAKE
jgi:hypothetical protein